MKYMLSRYNTTHAVYNAIKYSIINENYIFDPKLWRKCAKIMPLHDLAAIQAPKNVSHGAAF